jgi:hypothetical protein
MFLSVDHNGRVSENYTVLGHCNTELACSNHGLSMDVLSDVNVGHLTDQVLVK